MKRLLAGLVGLVLLAACSSGRNSITDAGNTPTTAPPSTTAAPSTTASPTTAAPSTVAGETTTTPAPTTTALADISQYPACPMTALDSASGTVNITVWNGFNAGAPQTEFQKLVDDYNASQTKVHVESLQQGGYEDVIAKYLQAGKGDLPDLVQMPEYATQAMIDNKRSIPAEACIRADHFDTSPFIDGAMLAWNAQDVQWGMPFNVSDPVLYYNKKVFRDAGLDPDKPPASIQEIRDVSQKIVDSGAAKYGLVVDSGFDSGGGWYLEQWFAQLGEFYADNENGRSRPGDEGAVRQRCRRRSAHPAPAADQRRPRRVGRRQRHRLRRPAQAGRQDGAGGDGDQHLRRTVVGDRHRRRAASSPSSARTTSASGRCRARTGPRARSSVARRCG